MKHIKPFNESLQDLVEEIDHNSYLKYFHGEPADTTFNVKEIDDISNIFQDFKLIPDVKRKNEYYNMILISSPPNGDLQVSCNLSKIADEYFISDYALIQKDSRGNDSVIDYSYYKIDSYDGLKSYYQYIINKWNRFKIYFKQ